ncbi:uncharacterized protein LOC125379319 [Haliotis rufescens]|uniref:uncharacterized protein LOC125379319 n=1 Tax=Haliotis rufescens TaxID=6454 RepID=UPI00201ED838|nr:uncharacterized protein LOC124128861 isoform X1 [Haliotis rufescens]XP_048251575.1 uncharacterized protein LOC124128861 isoform X1 [Haliotis rufescens]XP_048251576.1 uncharacterized protein LOC124128861 isoform X1 [Haliotis rufescens]XP_048251578.1 uncharacterized protein LOC125379319 [Haliotis rufescens]
MADILTLDVDEEEIKQWGSVHPEVMEGAPGMKFIKFIPNMDCPACLDTKTFASRRDFEEHWARTHHRVHKSFACPVKKCLDCRSSLKSLKYHIAHKHLNSNVITAQVDKLCADVTVEVERNENFVDPGVYCLSWQTWRPRGKRAGKKGKSAKASSSCSALSVQTSQTVTEPKKEYDSVPLKCSLPNVPSVSDLQMEIAALRERNTVMQQALAAHHGAHWPTCLDIPTNRPQLDEFIAKGWEAMAVLQSAEGRRFQQQLDQRRAADAFIRGMAHGSGSQPA